MSDSFKPKVLPQDLNAEGAVLSAMLVDSECVPTAIELLTVKDFYRNTHKLIFGTMIEMFNRSDAIDIITLIDALKAQKLRNKQQTFLEMVGGESFINDLSDMVLSGENVKFHANIVLEKAMMRKCVIIAEKLATEAYAGELSPSEVIGNAESAIFAANKTIKSSYSHVSEIVPTVLKNIEIAATTKELLAGIPSGLRELDRFLGGFRSGQLIVLAARPAMGKSSFALNVASNAVSQFGKNAFFVTLEMEKEECVQRVLSSGSEVTMDTMLRGYGLDENKIMRIHHAGQNLSATSLYIDDDGNNTITDVRAKAMRLDSEVGLDIMFIDYMQLMSAVKKSASRQEDISEISRRLKLLAKELGIPIIALSQLNRGIEGRDEKRPKLSDLRESGAIEQDADVVMFIYRDEVYNQFNKEGDMIDNEGKAEIIIAKNRHGSIGTVHLEFIKQFTRFQDIGDY